MSDSKLQFIYATCDVTCCIHAEGVLDSLLFRLYIFQVFFFSSYKAYIYILELGTTKESRFITVNATGYKIYLCI